MRLDFILELFAHSSNGDAGPKVQGKGQADFLELLKDKLKTLVEQNYKEKLNDSQDVQDEAKSILEHILRTIVSHERLRDGVDRFPASPESKAAVEEKTTLPTANTANNLLDNLLNRVLNSSFIADKKTGNAELDNCNTSEISSSSNITSILDELFKDKEKSHKDENKPRVVFKVDEIPGILSLLNGIYSSGKRLNRDGVVQADIDSHVTGYKSWILDNSSERLSDDFSMVESIGQIKEGKSAVFFKTYDVGNPCIIHSKESSIVDYKIDPSMNADFVNDNINDNKGENFVMGELFSGSKNKDKVHISNEVSRDINTNDTQSYIATKAYMRAKEQFIFDSKNHTKYNSNIAANGSVSIRDWLGDAVLVTTELPSDGQNAESLFGESGKQTELEKIKSSRDVRFGKGPTHKSSDFVVRYIGGDNEVEHKSIKLFRNNNESLAFFAKLDKSVEKPEDSEKRTFPDLKIGIKVRSLGNFNRHVRSDLSNSYESTSVDGHYNVVLRNEGVKRDMFLQRVNTEQGTKGKDINVLRSEVRFLNDIEKGGSFKRKELFSDGKSSSRTVDNGFVKPESTLGAEGSGFQHGTGATHVDGGRFHVHHQAPTAEQSSDVPKELHSQPSHVKVAHAVVSLDADELKKVRVTTVGEHSVRVVFHVKGSEYHNAVAMFGDLSDLRNGLEDLGFRHVNLSFSHGGSGASDGGAHSSGGGSGGYGGSGSHYGSRHLPDTFTETFEDSHLNRLA